MNDINKTECHACGSSNVSKEPTPFDDDEGKTTIIVYRCRDCGMIDVPGFPVPTADIVERAAA